MRKTRVLHISPILERPTGPGYSVPSLLAAQIPFLDVRLVMNGHEDPIPRLGKRPFAYGNLDDLLEDPVTVFRPPFDRPDLVVFHACFYPSYLRISRVLRARGVPYVITPRGSFQKEALRRKFLKKWLGIQLLFKPFFRGTAAIHYLTEEERRNSESWGRPAFVVPNGIHPVTASLRARPGKGRRPILGFLGRVDMRHKGLDLLVEACALAVRELRAAGAKVVLYGPDHEGTSLLLDRLIRERGIGDLVSLGGVVTGKEKDRVLKGFDLFLHPSRHEGQPIAVLEAMARGLPVLVTPGTNLMEEVRRAGCGFAVEGTQEAIAGAIREALRDRKGLAAKGAKGLAFSRRYDWRQVARLTARAYRTILSGRRP